MSEHTTVGGIARDLGAKLGKDVSSRVISDLFYKRILSDERCPILGGRRLIPRDYVPEIERALRERGSIPSHTEEMNG